MHGLPPSEILRTGVDEMSVWLRAAREREAREAERDARLAAWVMAPHLRRPLRPGELLGEVQEDPDPFPRPGGSSSAAGFFAACRAWHERQRLRPPKPRPPERWERWRTR